MTTTLKEDETKTAQDLGVLDIARRGDTLYILTRNGVVTQGRNSDGWLKVLTQSTTAFTIMDSPQLISELFPKANLNLIDGENYDAV